VNFPKIGCPFFSIRSYLSPMDQACLKVTSKRLDRLVGQVMIEKPGSRVIFDIAKAIREREEQEFRNRWTYKLKIKCQFHGRDALFGFSGACSGILIASRIAQGALGIRDACFKYSVGEAIISLISGCGTGTGVWLAIIDTAFNTPYINSNIALAMIEATILTPLTILGWISPENLNPVILKSAVVAIVVARSVWRGDRDRQLLDH
jgi:hypothetical protein